MNEKVLVKFIFHSTDLMQMNEKINTIPDSDLKIINISTTSGNYCMAVGSITAEYASFIKLSDPFLAERMSISYISDSVKNKYRN